jgi:hypothetical protein
MCFISSCVNSLEKAIEYESKKEEDEVMKKMEEIENILEKEEENNEDDSLSNLKKQILWVNYENNNDLYNEIFGKIKNMLLFKNANQVISFLKYLFALKPLMQFKSLKHKLCIVIQYSSVQKDNKGLKDRIFENIHALLEWLYFVGCKIPVIIYCESNYGFLQKIQVSTSYKLLTFTDNLNSIDKFINEEDEEDENKNNEYQIVHVNKFTLYRVSYVIIKKENENQQNNDEDSGKENSGDEEQVLINKDKKNNDRLVLNILENQTGENNKEMAKNQDSSLVSKSSYSSSSSKSDHSN